MEIVPVKLSHIQSILDIYAPYVESTAITFEYEVPSYDEFKLRVTDITEEYPYLVVLDEGAVVAYGYAHRFKERKAYDWDVELSVYVDAKYKGYHLGKALYKALLEVLEQMNIRNAYGIILADNHASQSLHEYFTFRKVGILTRTGYKFNQWHDVLIYEKSIGEIDGPVKNFLQLDALEVDKILKNAACMIRK